MLTASCPNCAAPIRFRHADSLTSVCGNCDSIVQRTDRDVSLIGRVSSIDRDLSPIQVGTTGRWQDVDFRVVGGLRKVRDRVRWNEWFLAFDDQSTGWLSESNGQHFLFRRAPGQGPEPAKLTPGTSLTLDARSFRVTEAARFHVAAANGELPFVLSTERDYPYADCRELDGVHLATIDGSDTPPSVWVGELVGLQELAMEGLRPFAGWSDPVLVNFAGPQIEGVRPVRCPSCSASLSVRSPGSTQALGCEYCGSELSVEAGDGDVALTVTGSGPTGFTPTLPLGQRGELEGIPWEIIGAMQRYVRFGGEIYAWTEYLLHNPYRGIRWLIEDATGHFNVLDPVRSWPRLAANQALYEGRSYKHFQKGQATVSAVRGEFTWEVHVGDEAATSDFIAPPFGLSRERTADEEVWTQSTYLPKEEVERSFQVSLVRPSGVYLNQPNPYQAMTGRVVLHTGLLTLVSLLLLLVALFTAANEVVLSTSQAAALSDTEQVWVTDTFTMPDSSRNRTEVMLDVPWDEYTAGAGVSFIHQETGQAVTPKLSPSGHGTGARWTARTPPLREGVWIARVELAYAASQRALGAGPLQLTVVRDSPWLAPPLWLLVLGFGLPVIWLLARGGFETSRWSQSDYA